MTRTVLILLAALHPELKMSDDVREFITDLQRKIPEAFWKKWLMRIGKWKVHGNSRIRRVTDPDELHAQMDSLVQRFAEQEKDWILDSYSFVQPIRAPLLT